MCGIFGFIAPAGTPWDADLMRHFISDLIGRSEPRGRDAAGLVIISDGQARVFKKAMRPDRLLKRRDFRDFMAANLGAATMPATGGGTALTRPLAVIGHCRLVTNGAEIVPGNNQPILAGKTVGIHNGIVTNDAELWALHDDLVRHLDTDSEIIFQLRNWSALHRRPFTATARTRWRWRAITGRYFTRMLPIQVCCSLHLNVLFWTRSWPPIRPPSAVRARRCS